MSLTIFVHKNPSHVGLVQWFRDPKFRIDYACGPLVEMDMEEFKNTGFDWIQKHFEEYAKKRLSEAQAPKVFGQHDAKKFLRDRNALSIWQDDSGRLWIAPLRIERYSLAGLTDTGRENHRCLPANFTEADFWKVFDEVLALAS